MKPSTTLHPRSFSMPRLAEAHAETRAIAKRAGLDPRSMTAVQALVLISLASNGLRMTDLARALGHTTAAATGAADALENLGLAERVHSTTKRTEIHLHITEAGKAALRAGN